MDRYVSVRKPTTAASYPLRTKIGEDGKRWSKPLSVDGKNLSSSTITKHLLNTLSDSSNPIMHSDIHERSDIVVSTTTGHQRGEGRTRHGDYIHDRSRKLSLQRRDKSPRGILSNVRVYIDGYLSGTTDIEMRRIIAQAGGTTVSVSSGATHVVTSQQLNGSKMHRILSTKLKSPVHVVKPEWITDSLAAGRRLQESRYSLIRSSGTRNLVDMIRSGGPR